ncbi:phosphoserine phosphatase SerB [Sphingomonas ginkgonis]|uniref:Phosphoserine phosphatase n=1 Tax=Sphingomonas ginkgonis TaxID=2315330 RepID=A0A3R9X8B5_9SPHN|nr:phosphoserine phosphatase SerB [Sphingomonas ginkgonis]RST31180.1 phosphoserine phosphatase SerB [Sphingomonas ginkgonis]
MIIVTLIAAGRLTRDNIHDARRLVADAGLESPGWRWLDEGDAADIEVEGSPTAVGSLRARLREGLVGIDVVVQLAEHRAKQLFVADMDSTMVGQECIDELADYAGLKAPIAAITERAMQGEIDFRQALEERVAALSGLGIVQIERCRRDKISHNPGAATLVRTLRARGATTLLVTGGFHDFADPLAAQLGFSEVRANSLESMHGHLTGRVVGEIVDSAAKRAALVEFREQMGLAPHQVMAVGDGANDLPMIEEAGLGVAYHAKPRLAQAADVRIDHNDLTALLWAQGIPRREWVAT